MCSLKWTIIIIIPTLKNLESPGRKEINEIFGEYGIDISNQERIILYEPTIKAI